MMNAADADAAVDARELVHEVGDCVRAFVLALEPPHRDILLLVELGGVSVADAARALGISVAHARVQRHHARNALRALLALSCAACPHPDCAGCPCEGCAATTRGHDACR